MKNFLFSLFFALTISAQAFAAGAMITAPGSVPIAANSLNANATASAALPAPLAIASSKVLGRGSSGNIAALTLGTALNMDTTTINGPCPSTYQYLTSGSSATYTTGTCNARAARSIHVVCVGGGGGGGAYVTNAGTNGNDTIFNSIHAKGGTGGAVGSAGKTGGAGGTGGTGSATLRIPGESGMSGYVTGAGGGASILGFGAPPDGETAAGLDAVANSGGGGGGGDSGANQSAGGGGGGEAIILDIAAPAASYTYTIAALANGGTAGTQAGGKGGSGFCIVKEEY